MGAGRLFCLARNVDVGVPASRKRRGVTGGVKSCPAPLRRSRLKPTLGQISPAQGRDGTATRDSEGQGSAATVGGHPPASEWERGATQPRGRRVASLTASDNGVRRNGAWDVRMSRGSSMNNTKAARAAPWWRERSSLDPGGHPTLKTIKRSRHKSRSLSAMTTRPAFCRT